MASLLTHQITLNRAPLLGPCAGPRSLSTKTLNFRSQCLRRTPKPLSLSRSLLLKPVLAVRASASSSSDSPLSESTRTVWSIVAAAASLSAVFTKWLQNVVANMAPTPQELASLRGLQNNLVCTMGPLFFAAKGFTFDANSAATPLTVVAAGMAKWLDIYSGVLMLRVLLSWFPNIPWDRQPLSAIRDLCDPYLNLFRNVIPPLFNSLDVSPLLAFAILGVLSSILTSSGGT